MDGLRGYAAAAVVIFHTILGSSPELNEQVLRQSLQSQGTAELAARKLVITLVSGEWAVTTFFVISGIVLIRALNTMHCKNGAGAAWAVAWRFLVRRALRIWPVMAVCVTVHTCAFQLLDRYWPDVVEAHSWRELLINVSLLRSPVNGATWTLAVELAGAPVLVLAFLGVRRAGLYGLLPFFLFAGLAFLHGRLLFHSPGLIVGLPALLIGVALEYGALDWASRRSVWQWTPVFGVLMVLAALLFVPMAAYKTHDVPLFIGVGLFVGWVRSIREGRVLQLLRAPFSQYLGRISFSLYLWNVPVFTVLLGLLDRRLLQAYPLLSGLAVGFATIAITIPIADLSERWLERGCIRLGRALTGTGLAAAARVSPHRTLGSTS